MFHDVYGAPRVPAPLLITAGMLLILVLISGVLAHQQQRGAALAATAPMGTPAGTSTPALGGGLAWTPASAPGLIATSVTGAVGTPDSVASPWPYPTLTVAPRPTAIGASTALASPRAATPDTLPPDQAALLELVIAGLDAAITSQPLPAELSPVVRQQLLALIERQDPYYQRRAWVVDWQPGPLTWTSGPAPGPALAVWHVALTGAVTLVTSDHLAPVVTAFDPSVNDLSVTLARDGDRWTVARVAGALFPTP